MNQFDERVRRSARLGDGHGALAAVAEAALHEAAGPGFAPTSLSLDYASAASPGEALEVEAWIDRAARTVVFAQAEARRAVDGAIVAVASGVFRRVEG